MSNRQIAAMIARRKAAENKAQRPSPMLAASLAAAGFNEHRNY